jgi:hypothetical protein
VKKRHISDRGLPLHDAAWILAPRTLKQEFARLQNPPSRDKQVKTPSDKVEALAMVFQIIGSAYDEAATRNKPLVKMRERLINQLRDGQLEAWGFRRSLILATTSN